MSAGTTPAETVVPLPQGDEELPLLDLESRLLVALSARGELRMGQIIDQAVFTVDGEAPICLCPLSDEDFVRSVERVVFGDPQ